MLLEVDPPLVEGQQVTLHIHSASANATIKSLIASYDKKKKDWAAKRPRVLSSGQMGIVEMTIPEPICLDYNSKGGCGMLTRVIVRARGRTIAAGRSFPDASAISIIENRRAASRAAKLESAN
eukprot:Platyproteum_vivax@DN9067_c0_g1_i1.p1